MRPALPLRLASKLTNSSVRRVKRRQLKDDISFEDFVVKGQVLHTYREMMRTIQKIPDLQARQEMHSFVKAEYRTSQNVTDLEMKRMLLMGGLRDFKALSNNLGLSMPDIKFE